MVTLKCSVFCPRMAVAPCRWSPKSLSILCSPSPSLSLCPPSTTSGWCQTAGSGPRPFASLTSRTSSCPRDILHTLVNTRQERKTFDTLRLILFIFLFSNYLVIYWIFKCKKRTKWMENKHGCDSINKKGLVGLGYSLKQNIHNPKILILIYRC